ncbi:TetR/AcrR family transcriptional regulator (plasmid) [Streptomyces sp. NBC_00876]|uniref:ScbR family autoregulator-binding transcription factor n=1 Tax=Streptomyces sp. NBC_00876 TaxID=2975853 RepID=UPI002F91A233|nr:TetR/AcrR family transcriptional regulator [Streptomyces sp. NBC_00876]
MAEQLRAIRTRQTILSAAAKIFEEHGYQAATISQILTEAGVTKGALYFHFHSKEDLAQGVLGEQDQRIIVPLRASKVQEIVDVVMLHAHRLQTDPMVRAGVRLTMDQLTQSLDRSGPFLRWGEVGVDLLQQAKAQGELLPHITPAETAEVIVGSFAGIQAMSQAVCEYRDLVVRVSALMRHVLPSAVVPSVLASLDLSEGRGVRVYEEAVKAAEMRDVLEPAM